MNTTNIKKPQFSNKLKRGKNGSSKLPEHSSIHVDTDKLTENHSLRRLKEMELLNFHMVKIIEQHTKKLSEVVSTNVKFISIIAHDLRGPFSSILGALELLREKLKHYKIDDIEDYLDLAENSATRTLNLLESLLDWAVSQNADKNFNPVKINLGELLQDVIENFNSLVKQKQLTLNHTIPPDLNVAADLQMVKTILRNLIGNAIKFTYSGGEICLSALEITPFVEITVKDNGIGISTEIQKRLLKKDRIFSSGTNNEQGAGLGLLLCKEFIEAHNGNILMESEPGKGSTVKFTLPHYI